TITLPTELVTFTFVFFHTPSFFMSSGCMCIIVQASKYFWDVFPASMPTPCWIVRHVIMLRVIFFSAIASPRLYSGQALAGSSVEPFPERLITSYGHASTHTPHPAQSSALKSRLTATPSCTW